jgi:ABC-type multidrug transport system ATPase subunit/ABC-type multidrug transport system permease subunit
MPHTPSPASAVPPNDREVVELVQFSHGPDSLPTPSGTPELSSVRESDSFERTRLTIAYRDVSLTVRVPIADKGVTTVLSPLVSAAKAVVQCGRNLRTRDFHRLDSVSGVLRHGTMTLILAPPGHGKSSFLKILSSRLSSTSGTIVYNGLTSEEAASNGCNTRRLTQYVDQIDEHLPLLTVAETLDFAHRVTCARYDPVRVENTLKLLGLEECKDTIIGNAIVRGVSGGQRRRATLGEMLVGDACALFLDEYTNGLDTATSEDITRGLRQWAAQTNGLIVATLQQPTPGLFALFDRIVVLKDSQAIYDGPREDLEPFFASMGFNCPEDVDICDFIIDCVSQPRVAFNRLQDNERRAAGLPPGASAAAPTMFASSCGTLQRTPAPCVTASQMTAHFRSTPIWRATERELDAILPPAAADSGSAPQKGTSAATDAAPEQQQQFPMSQREFAPLMPSPETVAMYRTGYTLPLLTLFWIVFSRQWKNLRRNTEILYPRLAQALVMGLMFGSLYWQIPENDFTMRVASLLIPLAQLGFGSMAEIASTVDANLVVLKQSGASFYPTWSFVLSAAVCGLPTVLIEAVALAIFYFMSGAVDQAGPFFVFYAMVVCATVMIGIWFRMLTACVNEAAAAYAISSPSTGISVLLGGYFVSMSNMPVWMRWLMWLSPHSWIIRALANNEFLSSRYSETADDGSTIGELYLRAVDYDVGRLWIGLGFLYVIGFCCVCMALHSFMLNRPNHESSRGTTRFADETEMLDNETDKVIAEDDEIHAEDPGLGSPVPALTPIDEAEPELAPQKPTPAGSAAPSPVPDASAVAVSASASSVAPDSMLNTLQTLREAVPFSPVWLTFSDVTYTVKVKHRDGNVTDRPLLRGVYGFAEPGKMTALMGASGAGKTTLLDVLAGRKNTGTVEGKIMLNGRVPTKKEFARVTGYVEQFDSLLPTDTVRESLDFAAHLRLPAGVSAEIKDRIVEEVLDILDLTSIADHMLGSKQHPGLSPSQLKRVSIGCELVANPAVLFLDEPTTGLDSRAAQTVMRVVRRIARSGRSVICTIHQPSAELFYLFDRLVLLAPGGHQIFFGDLGTRSKRFVKYLESVPKVQPIPHRVNPASWMLEELGIGIAGLKAPKPKPSPEASSEEPEESKDADDGAALADAGTVFAAEDDDEPQATRVARFVAHYKASSIRAAVLTTVRTIEALTVKAVTPALEDEHEDGDHGDADGNDDHAGDGDNEGGDGDAGATIADGYAASTGLVNDPIWGATESAGPSLAGLTLMVTPPGDAAPLSRQQRAPTPKVSVSRGAPGVVSSAHTRSRFESVSRAPRFSTTQISHLSHVPLPTCPLSLSSLSEAPSVPRQFSHVMARAWRAYFRSAPMLLSRWAVLLGTTLVCCCVYFRIAVDSQAGLTSYISALSVIVMLSAFTGASSAFPGKILDRPVFYREISSAMYRPYLWFFADLFCDLFWGIWSTFVVQIPIYFMVGLIMDAGSFFKYAFAIYLYFAAFISVSMAVAASVPNAPMGNIILGIFYTLNYSFNGIAVPLPLIPKGWVWLYRLLPASHFSEALVMPQFHTCSPLPSCSPLITVVDGGTTTLVPVATFASDFLGFVLDGYWNAIGWAVLFMACTWVVAFFMISKVRFDQR